MITKAVLSGYASELKEIKKLNLDIYDEFMFYIYSLLSFILTPFWLVMDILLLPLELGFIIFKSCVLATNKRANNE